MKNSETKSARGKRIMKTNCEVHRLHLLGRHLEATKLFDEMIK